ncbi:MAG: hypothetical protein ACRC7R_07710 [Sarcina sp.]
MHFRCEQNLNNHFDKALEGLSILAYNGAKDFYNVNKHQTTVEWKDLGKDINGEHILSKYDKENNTIYISNIYKSFIPIFNMCPLLIAAIQHEIIHAYLDRELQLPYHLYRDGSFFFSAVVYWFNWNISHGEQEVRENRDSELLFDHYYDQIFTGDNDISDFDDFDDLTDYLYRVEEKLSGEIKKLVSSLNQLTPEDEVYDIKIRFNETVTNDIEIATQQVANKTNSVKLIELKFFTVMYYDLDYIRQECLKLIRK